MRGRHTLGRKRASDFGKASAATVLQLNAVDDCTRKRLRTAGWTPWFHRSSRLDVLPKEPFELVNRDEPLTPRQLHRLDGRYEPSVDR
jgi:hypothetical protein